MRVVVAGGKLQGVEAAYLAHQAVWSVLLVDKNPAPPARGLSDQFCHLDIILDSDKLTRIISGADFIIPAIEDEAVLKSLEQVAQRVGIPNACDLPSYSITSSKKRSTGCSWKKGSAPYWPECDYPVIAKPQRVAAVRGQPMKRSCVMEEFGSRRTTT